MFNRLSTAQRSPAVAVWLFVLAALVLCMIVLGGATRLTHSGLSITEWKPVRGVVPPLNDVQWQAEFANYRKIPEYRLVNRGMSLAAFKGIYWWEWAHRLLGRLIGLFTIVPLAWFLIQRELPRRLIWRCVAILALGALQGLIGWWMVASGLEHRISVAPERLAIHLGTALVLFVALIWTGLEAWEGPDRVRPSPRWVRASTVILGLVFFQMLLGALVAGNRAGLVYNDWPLMNGHFLPPVSWRGGVIRAFLHDQALVQFDHRLGAYFLLVAASAYGFAALRATVLPETVKIGLLTLAGLVWLQALLGVATLMAVAPLWLSILHQTLAVVVLGAATWGVWRTLRVEERLFAGAVGSRGLW